MYNMAADGRLTSADPEFASADAQQQQQQQQRQRIRLVCIL
jgi:hypothetical protein